MNDVIKSPPHSLEAEQGLLGAVLKGGVDIFERIDLSDADFYRPDHRLIYSAMEALTANNQPIDVITVAEYLEAKGKLKDAGEMAYIVLLARDVLSSNVEAYADIVCNHAKARESLRLLADAQTELYSGSQVDDVLMELQGGLEGVSVKRVGLSFREVLNQSMKTISAAQDRHKKGIEGLTFGLPLVDRITGGLCGPKLIILAARPSMGKTALANQLALHAAARDYGIGKLELEMGADEIGIRAMAYAYQENVTHLSHGDSTVLGNLRRKVIEKNIRDYPIYLDESAYSMPEIVSRITQWHRQHNISAAVIDHLQLVSTAGVNRNQELGAVTRQLKRLAKRLNMPVIVLSQLNRSVTKEKRRPTMADLRDSGEIEQDADIVIALHGELEQDEAGYRDIDIGFLKHRGGRVGWLENVFFKFDGRLQRFMQIDNYA